MDETGWQQRIVIRLFRLWAMAREDGEPTLGRMYEVASEFRLPDQTTSSCASLFALVEGALGRVLVRGASCAPVLSADEVALLGVIEAAPSLGAMRGSPSVPHGLPGAIRWAAICVRDAVGWPPPSGTSEWPERVSGGVCPFAASKDAFLAR